MPKSDCKFCGGTGWRISEKDGVSSAGRCSCTAEAQIAQVEAKANIPLNYRTASFETFHLPHDNPVAQRGLADVMLEVKSYTRAYPDNAKPGLLLVGSPGTGKTHLAVAALRLLLERGFEGIFYDYQNLLQQIRSGFDEKLGTSSREAYRNALESDILLLDDLGSVQNVTNWVQDTVTEIVTHRCNHRKPLIATANPPDPDMGGILSAISPTSGKLQAKDNLEMRIGERARSRLFEMCKVIRMPNVSDYRIRPHRIGVVSN